MIKPEDMNLMIEKRKKALRGAKTQPVVVSRGHISTQEGMVVILSDALDAIRDHDRETADCLNAKKQKARKIEERTENKMEKQKT